MKTILVLSSALALASFASVASADPPHIVPVFVKVMPARAAATPPAEHAPVATPTPSAPRAPKVIAVHASASTAKAATSATPPPPIVAKLMPHSSDPGLSIAVDEHAGTVTIAGVAEGPQELGVTGGKPTDKLFFGTGVYMAKAVSFTVEPADGPVDFSKDPDFSRKNKWFEARTPQWMTQKGQSADFVADKLAEKLNAGGAYKATVDHTAEGAIIHVAPR